MNLDIPSFLAASAGAISVLGGLYASYRHVRYSFQAKKDREKQVILDKANEELDKVRKELESKIKLLQDEFQVHKEVLGKDLGHMREIYNAEIRQLGEKIENLRSDLGEQHAQMVELLTRLVSKS